MTKQKKILCAVLCALLLLCIAFGCWVIWANTALERTDYTIASARLPAEFEGFRIAQIPDLHCAEYE